LQRELDQAHAQTRAQTRAQRKTPELPVLKNLVISTDEYHNTTKFAFSYFILWVKTSIIPLHTAPILELFLAC